MKSVISKLELARLIEFTEGAAHANMFGWAPPEFGFTVEETSDYVARFAPTVDLMLFNRVLGLGLNSPATKDVVDVLVKRYRDSGVTNFAIQLSPEAQPPEVVDWLTQNDLSVRDYWTKVYRLPDPNVSIPTDLRIEQIDSSMAGVFAETACVGFEMPNTMAPVIAAAVGRPKWAHYIAWDGETPAAVAALFMHNGVGWLGLGATLPEYRRRGAQGALMTRRIRDGAKFGCKWMITEAAQDLPDKPNPSFHNMVRAGFEVAYHRPNYMLPKRC